MKIVHIAYGAIFTDGFGYQENLLTKYQAKIGHDVTLIVQNLTRNKEKIVETECKNFYASGGFEVITCKVKKYKNIILKYIFNPLAHMSVFDHLVRLKPDMIFYHGLSSDTILQVIQYKKK